LKKGKKINEMKVIEVFPKYKQKLVNKD